MWRRNDGRGIGLLLATGLTLTGLTGCGLVGGDDHGEFCGLLKDQLPAYTADPLTALAPNAGAGAWKAHFDLMHQRGQKLVDTAPGDVKPAVTSLLSAGDKLSAFLATVQYDPGQVDSGAVTQLLSDTGYPDAVTKVTGYAKGTCKITAGSAG